MILFGMRVQGVFSNTGRIAMDPQGHQIGFRQQVTGVSLAHELSPQLNDLRQNFFAVFHKVPPIYFPADSSPALLVLASVDSYLPTSLHSLAVAHTSVCRLLKKTQSKAREVRVWQIAYGIWLEPIRYRPHTISQPEP